VKKMKRILFIFVVAFSAIFVLGAKPALAAKSEKVAMCHIIEANGVVYGFWGVVDLHFGKKLSISENALSAHDGHNYDSATFFGGANAEGPINAFRNAGLHLPAADCYVSVPMQ
jgi:hypothetical protein